MRSMTLIALAALAFTACSQSHAHDEEGGAHKHGDEATEIARDDAKWKYFGEPFTVSTALPLAKVMENPEQHAKTPVRVTGELSEVCQKMGCWAVVRDGQGNSMRITMKDHAFGIDKDTKGREVDLEGQLVSKPVDPKQLEHYAEEGATEHPEAGKSVAWSVVASSVAVARK